MNSYQNLISKLDAFIKKYYKIKILRGFIIFITLIIFIWLTVSFSEFYFGFSSVLRLFIFYAVAAVFSFLFLSQIFIPFLKLVKIGKTVSYKQAAEIISKHFSEIQDKLINILELKEENEKSDNVLIEAAINQKSESIKLIPFTSAVNYSQLKKYLKFFLPVFLVFVSVMLISPAPVKEGTKHIINYSEEFKEPPPFSFFLVNKNLKFKRGDDIKIKLKIKGKYLPENVFINYGGSNFYMQKEKNSKTEFFYELKNVYNSFEFYFSADDLISEKYKAEILPSPLILDYFLNIDVPEYTGEKDTVLKNITEIIIPFGSKIDWNFTQNNAEKLAIKQNDKTFYPEKQNDKFVFSQRYFKETEYILNTENKYFKNDSILKIKIGVIPDLFPSVNVEQIKDTADFFITYFKGFINDDYGFNKLLFKFRVTDINNTGKENQVKYNTANLPVLKNKLKQTFYYAFNFNDLNPSENQKIEYFFEVWDNDAVSGSKKSRTPVFTFNIPSHKEIDSLENIAEQNINSKIEKSISLAEEIKNDIRNLREKNLQGNISDWENKQMLQSILDKQNLLKKLTQEIAHENKQKNNIKNKLSEQDKELLKKQKEIQKLLEEVMTPELKELMKQLEELQNKFNRELMKKLLKEQEFSYKEMSERLDRTKELLKREQTEQKVNKTIEKLNKLSEKQKDLANQTKEKALSKDELLNKQKQLSEEFKEAMKQYEEAKKLNEELKHKLKLDDFEKEKNDIEQEFNKSEENLSKNKKNKASDSQNKNSDNMKKLADKMASMMQANSMEQKGENEEALRKILDNLLNFSFKQENLTKKIRQTKNTDPKIIKLFEMQSDMSEDFKIIEDSLKALAYRIPQINNIITGELKNISFNLEEIKKKLQDRKISSASVNQNKVMTSANNLALLLQKMLNQMKNSQSSGSGSGSGSKKPQSGKQEAMQDLKSMQESLKKQMEEMLKQMQEGKGSFNKDAQMKQLAKMLAQEEIFKQMLKELQSGYSLNPETKKLLNEIQKMAEENKKDIVKRRITPELLERQKKIETRLLEAEKAENKRKFDKKREAETPDNKIYKSPEDVFKNIEKKSLFNEDLYKNNIRLNNFYKKLYDEYSKTLNR